MKTHQPLMGSPFGEHSVWRVTNGPTSDWPIAFCDYNTVAPDDVELNDVIHRTYVGESTRLQYSQSQKWYFLRDQAVDEVALFRNTDSTGLLPGTSPARQEPVCKYPKGGGGGADTFV